MSGPLPFTEEEEDDTEGGLQIEDTFCPAINGLGPHNYQPALDLMGGSGIWLFCNHCGDYFHVDGTAMTVPPAQPAPAPQQGGNAAPAAPARPSFP